MCLKIQDDNQQISQKYAPPLIIFASFNIVKNIFNKKLYFVDLIYQKIIPTLQGMARHQNLRTFYQTDNTL